MIDGLNETTIAPHVQDFVSEQSGLEKHLASLGSQRTLGVENNQALENLLQAVAGAYQVLEFVENKIVKNAFRSFLDTLETAKLGCEEGFQDKIKSFLTRQAIIYCSLENNKKKPLIEALGSIGEFLLDGQHFALPHKVKMTSFKNAGSLKQYSSSGKSGQVRKPFKLKLR